VSNEWADMTDLSSSWREFHRQSPLNVIDLCPMELCIVKMKMLSTADVMHMDHIILDKVTGKYG